MQAGTTSQEKPFETLSQGSSESSSNPSLNRMDKEIQTVYGKYLLGAKVVTKLLRNQV